MVKCGGEDVAALFFSGKESLDEDVQGIGRILGKHDMFRGICMSGGGRALPGPW